MFFSVSSLNSLIITTITTVSSDDFCFVFAGLIFLLNFCLSPSIGLGAILWTRFLRCHMSRKVDEKLKLKIQQIEKKIPRIRAIFCMNRSWLGPNVPGWASLELRVVGCNIFHCPTMVITYKFLKEIPGNRDSPSSSSNCIVIVLQMCVCVSVSIW